MADKLKKDLPAVLRRLREHRLRSQRRAVQPGRPGRCLGRAGQAQDHARTCREPLIPFATQAQLDKAGADLATGEQQAAAGKAQLDKSAADLAAGKAQLDAAEAQMTAAGLPTAAIEARLGQQKAALADRPGEARRRHQGPRGRQGQAGARPTPAGRLPGACASSPRTARPPSPRSSSRPRSTGSSPEVRQEVQDIVKEVSAANVTALPSKEISEDISEIFGTAEVIGIAVAALVLMVMLGTLIAAGLPLLMAISRRRRRRRRHLRAQRRRGHELHLPDAGPHARPRGRDRLLPVHRQPAPRPTARRDGPRGVRGAGHRHLRQRGAVRRPHGHHRPRGPRGAGVALPGRHGALGRRARWPSPSSSH